MSGEARVYVGTAKTLEANGAAITSGALAQADDASYDVVVDGGGYPHGEFALVGTFAASPTENTVLALYARPLDVDGTADTEIPETTRPTVWIGNFVVNNTASAQVITLRSRDLPLKADYYVHNYGTGQTLSAGWTLKVTPLTVGPV